MAVYLTQKHVTRAANLAGAGCSLREILEDLEIDDAAMVTAALDQCGITIQPGPDDRTTVNIMVGPDATAGFRAAAVARDIVGADKVRVMLQRVVDSLGGDVTLLDNILSDGMRSKRQATAPR